MPHLPVSASPLTNPADIVPVTFLMQSYVREDNYLPFQVEPPALVVRASDYERLRAELHAARTALTASEKPAWQPIATAPHMRKIIVHYLNPAGKHRTVMACYYEKNSLEMHDDYAEVGTYDAEKDGYFADEGWYEEHDSDDPIMKLQGEPDHWMPLPEPPK